MDLLLRGVGSGNRIRKTFSPKSGQTPGATVTSNRIRLTLRADTLITCTAGAEFSLNNGVTWITTATVGGVVRVRIRGDASDEYGTSVIHTLITTAGVVVTEYDFTISTSTAVWNDLGTWNDSKTWDDSRGMI